MNRRYLFAFLAILAFACLATTAEPLGSAFTYQGQLQQSGSPANGPSDFQFSLWDARAAGTLIGATQTVSAVNVNNGLFTVALDFGLWAFNGDARWLEIGVRAPAGSGQFTVLSPRQPVAATPYALHAATAAQVPIANLTGTLPDARLSPNVALLNTSPVFRGTVTADEDMLADRLIIGSGHSLTAANSTIAGGLNNTNNSSFAFIGGGLTNIIQTNAPYAFIGGGRCNNIQTAYGTIGGGLVNTIDAPVSTIGGVGGNTIQTLSQYSTIGGGGGNTIQTKAEYATIGGGSGNTINSWAYGSIIAGGYANTIQADAYNSTIAGGRLNNIQTNAYWATIPGGLQNTAGGSCSFAAGYGAQALHDGSFVWGESSNLNPTYPPYYISSLASNSWTVRASGGVRFFPTATRRLAPISHQAAIASTP